MSKKILIVVTNHSIYDKTKEPTGLWLSELVHFYDLLKKQNDQLDIASVLGGAIPLDPGSITERMLDEVTKKYYNDKEFMERLKHSMKLGELDASQYAAIYFTGGHGTMWDFPETEEIKKYSQQIYENGGIVAAVCHGVGALLNIKLSQGNYLIEGKEITGYSTKEEELAKALDKIPFNLEDALKERGAKYKKALLPFTSFAKVDGRVITGQNPQSTSAVAKLVIKQLH